jgi:uncharacterized small protein (TIGR04563 family)
MTRRVLRRNNRGRQSVYLGCYGREVVDEAHRLDRHVSWVVRHAVRLALRELRALPHR